MSRQSKMILDKNKLSAILISFFFFTPAVLWYGVHGACSLCLLLALMAIFLAPCLGFRITTQHDGVSALFLSIVFWFFLWKKRMVGCFNSEILRWASVVLFLKEKMRYVRARCECLLTKWTVGPHSAAHFVFKTAVFPEKWVCSSGLTVSDLSVAVALVLSQFCVKNGEENFVPSSRSAGVCSSKAYDWLSALWETLGVNVATLFVKGWMIDCTEFLHSVSMPFPCKKTD